MNVKRCHPPNDGLDSHILGSLTQDLLRNLDGSEYAISVSSKVEGDAGECCGCDGNERHAGDQLQLLIVLEKLDEWISSNGECTCWRWKNEGGARGVSSAILPGGVLVPPTRFKANPWG
jgi:hypothetical protein